MRTIVVGLLLFVVWAYAEVSLLLYVADRTSIFVALLLTIVTGIAGIVLARAQGWQLMVRARQELGRGKVPVESLLSGLILFFAGVLLLIPGLISDVLGLLLLLPPVHRAMARSIRNWFQTKVRAGTAWIRPSGNRSSAHENGDVVDSYTVPPAEEPRLEDERRSGP